jgi:hypothetical protein
MNKRLLFPVVITAALVVFALIPGLVLASSSHAAPVHHTAAPVHHMAIPAPCVQFTGAELQECIDYVAPTPNSADFPTTDSLFFKVLRSARICSINMGIPTERVPNVNWSGAPISKAAFSSGLRAEVDASNVARLYNQSNQQLCAGA